MHCFAVQWAGCTPGWLFDAKGGSQCRVTNVAAVVACCLQGMRPTLADPRKKGSTLHSMSKPFTRWEELIEGTTALRLEGSDRHGAGPGQRQLVARMAQLPEGCMSWRQFMQRVMRLPAILYSCCEGPGPGRVLTHQQSAPNHSFHPHTVPR